MLIDVTIPKVRNVIQKESEQVLQYKDRTIEIQCMWNLKSRVLPLLIGAIRMSCTGVGST
jgi:hypothetical protein